MWTFGQTANLSGTKYHPRATAAARLGNFAAWGKGGTE